MVPSLVQTRFTFNLFGVWVFRLRSTHSFPTKEDEGEQAHEGLLENDLYLLTQGQESGAVEEGGTFQGF